MFFRRIKTPGIAHNAYMIGNGGTAAVIDPRRDVDEYLAIARANGLTIRYVVETHRQEDFVAGSAALRGIAGAAIIGGDHALFGHADRRLKEGEELDLSGLRLRALATPGHTPESTSWAVFVPGCPGGAWGVFTGDALFVGDTGRTDLPDPRATAENAGLLYDSARAKIFPLGDQTLLFPAHGAGSACGRHIAPRDDSTLGLEKLVNPVWRMSRADFMAHKQAERIPRPPYFSLMERVNLDGGRPADLSADRVRVLQPEDFVAQSRHGLVIDTRPPEAFAGGHVPRAYSIWLAGLSSFAGWVADDAAPVYLILEDPAQLETAVAALARIGIDRVEGFLAGGFASWRDAGLPIVTTGTVDAVDLARDLPCYGVLDVREVGEYEEGHIEGAVNVYVGDLERCADELAHRLPRDRPVAVVCSVGHRASLGVSILQRLGYRRVHNLLGGMTAWGALEAGGHRETNARLPADVSTTTTCPT